MGGLETSEPYGPSLLSQVVVSTHPLVVLVPTFLPPASCEVLLQMCLASGEDSTLLDPANLAAPWGAAQRALLAAVDHAIGELAGQPSHDGEPPLSSLAVHPSELREPAPGQRFSGCSAAFPAGLHVDTNGGCPRRFAAAVLYLTSPAGGQTAFPLAGQPTMSMADSLPLLSGPKAAAEVVDAGKWLLENGVEHTKQAILPEEASAAARLLLDAADSGTGLQAHAVKGSLVLFWCRRGEGICGRSWHSGRRVSFAGGSKWILRKFKSMPEPVWESSAETITSYVRATRMRHLLSKPQVSEEGVAFFEASPQSCEGRELSGSLVWDGGKALAKFLSWREARGEQPMAGRLALELGAGTGIVGLTLGRLGARVTVTDREPEVLALLRRNVEANALGGRLRVCSLDFEDARTFLGQPPHGEALFDLVVASEVLYESGHRGFAAALSAHLAAGPDSEALLAYTHREEFPLEAFFSDLSALGFLLARLEDHLGRAVAAARGAACAYDGGHFRAVHIERAADAIREAVLAGHFSPGNEAGPGGGGVQILRLKRRVPTREP